MQKGLKKVSLALVAVGLSITLLLTVAFPVCQAGPEERVVKIGLHAVFTGAAATSTAPGCEAMLDYVRYINDRGGFNGVKLDVDWYECAGLRTREMVAYKRIVEAGAVLDWSVLQGAIELIAPSFPKDGIPMTFLGGYSEDMLVDKSGAKWIFSATPGKRDEAGVALKWFKENWVQERQAKVGALFWDERSGWEALEGVKIACKYLEMEFIGHEVVPMLGTIDTSTEWLRLAGKNPDCVYFGGCGATLTTVVKDCARLEIMEKGITVISPYPCIDESVAIAGKEADGIYSAKYAVTPAQTEIPGVKLCFETARKYRGWGLEKWERLGGIYITGWLQAQVGVEGVRLALEKVGYENLSGYAVRDALASIKYLDTGGLVPPITMSDAWPVYTHHHRMYQARGGKFYPIDEKWIEYPRFPGCVEFE